MGALGAVYKGAEVVASGYHPVERFAFDNLE